MADGFSREISRVVVGQLAEVAGYESVQDSAAEILGGRFSDTYARVHTHTHARTHARTHTHTHTHIQGSC